MRSVFLDSGAFTFHSSYVKKHGKRFDSDFHNTKEFWDYVDRYAEFIKEYKDSIDYYANVDVIGNPDASDKVQVYLEDRHGLEPVPVVHFESDLSWLEYYIQLGYDLVCLGGLVGGSVKRKREWLDHAFSVICDSPDNLPRARTHAFGMTSYSLMLRYPWWSADSTSWAKWAGYGLVCVPFYRGIGKFDFSRPSLVYVTERHGTDIRQEYKFLETLPRESRRGIRRWFQYIGLQEEGIIASYKVRRAANLRFFEEAIKSLPEYPWPFNIETNDGFGLVWKK